MFEKKTKHLLPVHFQGVHSK